MYYATAYYVNRQIDRQIEREREREIEKERQKRGIEKEREKSKSNFFAASLTLKGHWHIQLDWLMAASPVHRTVAGHPQAQPVSSLDIIPY